MDKTLKDIDVLILTGGQGTRLRSVVHDRPKTMAKIGQGPFLDIILGSLVEQGFKRFILCTGYMGEYIQDYYSKKFSEYEISISHEEMPLGTGGAIRNAKASIKSKIFLALNGDSYCHVDFREVIRCHLENEAMLTMVVAESPCSENFGNIKIHDNNRIRSFREKVTEDGDSLVNTGIYCLNRSILDVMSKEKTPYSLETDFFPSIMIHRCFGYVSKSMLYDIGTPSGLNQYIESGIP
jgi:D-glycero-alpha-D-manno-heptose 1-phosphate guanylyltransferase